MFIYFFFTFDQICYCVSTYSSDSRRPFHCHRLTSSIFACTCSATKELENPLETAETIGLAALIIQVCLNHFPMFASLKEYTLSLRAIAAWHLLTFRFRISRAVSHLIISLAGIGFSRVEETQVCSCSTHMPDSTGERIMQSGAIFHLTSVPQ